jgi:hypothetical protein
VKKGKRKGYEKPNSAVSWQQWLRGLYEADTRRGRRFRYGLLAFDLVTVAFIIVTSFLPRMAVISALDVGSACALAQAP